MRSDALESIVTMLRTTAAGRGDQEMTLAEWRDGYAALGAFLPSAEGVAVTPVDAGSVRAEWIAVPGGAAGATIVYLHGGGYCIGGLDTHRPMLTHLARAADARVLAVDYRLAPEHPYPAALDDAVDAYRWVLAGGVSPARTVIAGDSAGGGLTVATLVALRDGGVPLPALGVCLSPWADLTQSGSTISSRKDVDPMVRADDLDRWANFYRGDFEAGRPSISPIFADLHGLPPLHVEVGTDEVLLDDARRLVDRARSHDVRVTLVEAEDMVHVWHFFAGAVPEADEGIERVGATVRDAVGS